MFALTGRYKKLLLLTGVVSLVWLYCIVSRVARLELYAWFTWTVLTGAMLLAGGWIYMTRRESTRIRALVASLAYLCIWQWLVLAADALDWGSARASLASLGTGVMFLVGLAWAVWAVDRANNHYHALRLAARRDRQDPAAPRPPREASDAGPHDGGKRNWNPLDTEAWYYGRSRKLNQSLATLTSYSLAFLLLALMLSQFRGCEEWYESPAGGGEQKTIAQTVQVQKVIKKKFVINRFSSIIFNPPPIDEVKLQLVETTQHMYAVGYGQGDGAGFAGGTKTGKVRFIRLEYAGGDWDQDFGVGADLNMLVEYGIRTQHKVHDRTESRTVMQLANFPATKSPPLVYMTGQKSISLSKSEIETLREYLLDKHGMIFADNGGSTTFHNQFFAMMTEVLPKVSPVRIPLDDVIHSVPYHLPFLPVVARHGGKDAWGWKLDGRWLVYYHPGDIGDAWTDDHAGVPREIYEACYQLGTNVIFYAHVEYNKWIDARSKQNAQSNSTSE